MTNGNGNTNTAMQTTQPTGAMSNIHKLFMDKAESIAQVIPRHLGADRLIKVALNSIAKTPALQKCSASTLLQCLITSAELGLEPGGALGHAYLVPYGQVCTLIIGYRGLIELSRRSGQLADIWAVVVHEKDKFEVVEGVERNIVHKPSLADDPGPVVAVYSVAKLKDGTIHFEWMKKSAVDKIRARSRAGNSGPWQTDYEEMAKKTVVRRNMKYLPMSSEIAKALDADGDTIDGEIVNREISEEMAKQLTAETPTERAKAAVKRKMNIVDVPALPEPEAIPPPGDADAPATVEYNGQPF